MRYSEFSGCGALGLLLISSQLVPWRLTIRVSRTQLTSGDRKFGQRLSKIF